MQLIIDANIIMAMLIRPGKPIDLFFHESLELYAPELLFKEVVRNIKTIEKKSRLNGSEIRQFIKVLRNNISIVPEEEFINYKDIAQDICPDEKDITYFALALKLKCGIWTNEKKLKEQDKVQIFNTHELINLFLV